MIAQMNSHRSKTSDHPAVKLGEFIKDQRIAAGLTMRNFYGIIKLT
jgi:hypothetical protein